MSNFGYKWNGFEISRAQAIQAMGARCEITPHLNPIMLKPLGDYYSDVFLLGKKYKKMHAKNYYEKFVRSQGLKTALNSLQTLQKKHDLVILEGAGSPAEINLDKFDIANMKMAEKYPHDSNIVYNLGIVNYVYTSYKYWNSWKLIY